MVTILNILMLAGTITCIIYSFAKVFAVFKRTRIYPEGIRKEYNKKFRIHVIFQIISTLCTLTALLFLNTILFYIPISIGMFLIFYSIYLYSDELANEEED